MITDIEVGQLRIVTLPFEPDYNRGNVLLVVGMDTHCDTVEVLTMRGPVHMSDHYVFDYSDVVI